MTLWWVGFAAALSRPHSSSHGPHVALAVWAVYLVRPSLILRPSACLSSSWYLRPPQSPCTHRPLHAPQPQGYEYGFRHWPVGFALAPPGTLIPVGTVSQPATGQPANQLARQPGR